MLKKIFLTALVSIFLCGCRSDEKDAQEFCDKLNTSKQADSLRQEFGINSKAEIIESVGYKGIRWIFEGAPVESYPLLARYISKPVIESLDDKQEKSFRNNDIISRFNMRTKVDEQNAGNLKSFPLPSETFFFSDYFNKTSGQTWYINDLRPIIVDLRLDEAVTAKMKQETKSRGTGPIGIVISNENTNANSVRNITLLWYDKNLPDFYYQANATARVVGNRIIEERVDDYSKISPINNRIDGDTALWNVFKDILITIGGNKNKTLNLLGQGHYKTATIKFCNDTYFNTKQDPYVLPNVTQIVPSSTKELSEVLK